MESKIQKQTTRDLGGLQRELDELRRSRLALVATVGAVMAVTVDLVLIYLGRRAPLFLENTPPYLGTIALHYHAITFVVAAIMFRVRSFRTQTILTLDLWFFGSNIVARSIASASIVGTGDHFPGIEGIMLALVLHGVFVPTSTLVASLLGIAAVGSFVVSQWLGYLMIPAIQAHWQQFQEPELFVSVVAFTALAISFFAFLGVMSSRLFYGLAKDAMKAKRLGNYKIESELSSGGMGRIYTARHLLMQILTAIKVLNQDQFDGEDGLTRFEREVELASKLSHPNTIAIYDYGRSSDGTFYYAMELLRGLNLQDLVKKYGPVEAARTIFILDQVCGSLKEAHDQGIVHRDIKPANIVLTERGGLHDFVKVIDFGLAKRVESPGPEDAEITKTGQVFGTPNYLAPEAVYGSKVLDHRADIYSLGGVAYWLLAGRKVFEGDTVQVLVDHINRPPIPVSKVSELEIPNDLEAIVLKCLEKSPKDRFQNVEEFRRALQSITLASPWTFSRASAWWSKHVQPNNDGA